MQTPHISSITMVRLKEILPQEIRLFSHMTQHHLRCRWCCWEWIFLGCLEFFLVVMTKPYYWSYWARLIKFLSPRHLQLSYWPWHRLSSHFHYLPASLMVVKWYVPKYIQPYNTSHWSKSEISIPHISWCNCKY